MSTIKLAGVCFWIVAAVLAFGACGGGQHQGGEAKRDLSVELARGTVGACLVNAGATQATSLNQLQFLKDAEDNDEIDEPGFAYDRKAKIMVSIMEQSPSAGASSRWMIWVAQPFGKSLSPFEIVNSNPPHSYVLFIDNASHTVSKRTEQCITFR